MRMLLIGLLFPFKLGAIAPIKPIVSCSPKEQYVVTLTTYSAVRAQCDNSPLITASGHRITTNDRIIAVSRDLKLRFNWGDSVIISNAGQFDGVYAVHDVMNKRYTNCIDVLSDKIVKLENIIIYEKDLLSVN